MIEELIIEGDFTIRGKGIPDGIVKHMKYLRLSTRMSPIIGIDEFAGINE